MRRSEGFAIFSMLFAVVLFAIMPTPPMLYLSLIYSVAVLLLRNSIKPKPLRLDWPTVLGAGFIVISPLFVLFKWGETPSPSMFQALLFLGVSLILFDFRTMVLPDSILLLEILLSWITRTGIGIYTLNWFSGLFVDMTSYLVRGLIDIFNVPILMRGNVAVVRNSIVIIGFGCSGLDAFVLYLLASLFLIYLRKSDRGEAALLLLGSLGIIPLNAVRIFTLLVIGYHSGISFLELFHSHLGDLMFLVYVFFYWWLVLKKLGE
ncbi:exosortase/archaeosortase family protein [Thermococcus siculi]|uniref:Exosortase/archaeosortase family protein n=1 Tax=Thermococcus siculi TaxID=72803 RepID=A0A2Z2MLR6_9EURY|nr:exosortase/archaeosortase family protein [Thermococcus siculi]ASJ08361.1 exosortase/archaeosortase family protein [Thermococcus siculi]